MIKCNSKNERVKRDYFIWLKEACQKSESTIDNIRKALIKYEEFDQYKDYETFNKNKAVEYKKYLASQLNKKTKKPLSKSTLLSSIRSLKDFYRWLSALPKYRSKINIHDIEFLNMSEKDIRAAKATRYKDCPTIDQIRKVISVMPETNDIEKRNKALIAFTLVTGARDSAIASLKLKHIRLDIQHVEQMPDEVNTKFSKKIDTFFFPVGDDIKQIVIEWVGYLIKEKLNSLNDPVFPKSKLVLDKDNSFSSGVLDTEHWQSAGQIRSIFKKSFESAGIKYYSPHTFRNTLVQLGERVCKTPEDFKAWSQNLGHESPLTTFTSYGYVPEYRQGDIIRNLSLENKDINIGEKLDLLLQKVGV